MKQIRLFFVVVVLFLQACSPGKELHSLNKLSPSEKQQGWQLLFDGKTTRGWHSYGGATAGAAWRAVEGTLLLDTSNKKNGKIVGGGDLVTDEEFENFDLLFEWKISPGGNSGVMIYVHEDPEKYKESYFTGPEMQVLDNERHSDANYPKHRAGDLYDLVACSKETVKSAGEWNQARIRSENGKLDFYLNGENVVSLHLWDDAWRRLIAGSKFKQWPGFGSYKKGRICLQDHDNQVQYRNIKIRRL